jgi:DedD protein
LASAFQNRLVGTVIIVALVVIFLPDILDGEKQTHDGKFVSLPDAPEMPLLQRVSSFSKEEIKQNSQRQIEIINEPAIDDEANSSSDNLEQSSTDTQNDRVVESNTPQTDNEQNTAEKAVIAEVPVIETDEASVGWVVQLGSFRHQKNVRELLNSLEKAGYRAFSRKVQTSNGELTKVFVGPDLNKASLEKALPHLTEVTSLKGRVTAFKVE